MIPTIKKFFLNLWWAFVFVLAVTVALSIVGGLWYLDHVRFYR